MSGPHDNDNLEERLHRRDRWIRYLYRYFIRLRNTTSKFVYQDTVDLDHEDYEILEPIARKFFEAEKLRE